MRLGSGRGQPRLVPVGIPAVLGEKPDRPNDGHVPRRGLGRHRRSRWACMFLVRLRTRCRGSGSLFSGPSQRHLRMSSTMSKRASKLPVLATTGPQLQLVGRGPGAEAGIGRGVEDHRHRGHRLVGLLSAGPVGSRPCRASPRPPRSAARPVPRHCRYRRGTGRCCRYRAGREYEDHRLWHDVRCLGDVGSSGGVRSGRRRHVP